MDHENAPRQASSFVSRFGGGVEAQAHIASFDFTLVWENSVQRHGGAKSLCRVSGCRTSMGPIVVMEDVARNTGPSVAIGLDDLIPVVMKRLSAMSFGALEDFGDALWLEYSNAPSGPTLYRIQQWPNGQFVSGGAGSEFPPELLAGLIGEGVQPDEGAA